MASSYRSLCPLAGATIPGCAKQTQRSGWSTVFDFSCRGTPQELFRTLTHRTWLNWNMCIDTDCINTGTSSDPRIAITMGTTSKRQHHYHIWWLSFMMLLPIANGRQDVRTTATTCPPADLMLSSNVCSDLWCSHQQALSSTTVRNEAGCLLATWQIFVTGCVGFFHLACGGQLGLR